MSDLFHEEIPDGYVAQVFDVMRDASQHQFQVLTKRAERMSTLADKLGVPPNVWIGVSVENAEFLFRVRHLQKVRATVRFLSVEPFLGPVSKLPLRGIHWVIVGGESGPGARPMEIEWVREVRAQCKSAGVAFFCLLTRIHG